MASQEVTLRAGESITLQLETAGRTYRLNLSLTEHGVSVTAPAEAKVEVHAPAMAGAGARSAHREAPREEPAEETSFEEESSVDIPSSEESEPVEVAEESHGMSDSEFSLDDESAVAESTAVDFTSGAQRDSSVDIPDEPLGGADNLSLTGVPGVSRSDDLALDEPGFTEQGLTMVPPSRHSRQPEPEPEPEPLLEAEESAQPLDAVSATLSPVRFHDPATDNLEQPEMEEKRPPAHAPQIKKPLAGPAPRAPQPAPAAPAAQADELPAWTGRARDYRDPKLEAKKAATAKLDKSSIVARQQAQPAPAPVEEEPLDLALDDEPPPVKKPTAPVPRQAPPAAKPAPVSAKPAMAPAPAKPAPMAQKPAPAPMAKPAPVAAAKPAPAPAAKPAPAAAAKPEGNFTVFLSPPKGAEKKQAAAEIIAEVQGIDINAATQLAGKMIVPVIKGVTEEDANKVRDRLKDAGLSCRITQKR